MHRIGTIRQLLLQEHSSRAVAYAGAAGVVGVAILLRVTLTDYLQSFATVPFFPAVFVAALLFSRGAGYLATVLSAAFIVWYAESAAPQDDVAQTVSAVSLLLFIFGGALVTAVTEALRATLRQLASAEQEKDLLLREVIHRTKNHFATIASILQLQAVGQPESTRKALEAAIGRVQVISRAHERLQRRNRETIVDARELLDEVCGEFQRMLTGIRPVRIVVAADRAQLDGNTALPVGLIVNELVTNAIKYAFPEDRSGTIKVAFHVSEPGNAEIVVEDDGIGYSPDGSDGGLGTRLVDGLAGQLGGAVSREPVPHGCRIAVRFPFITPNPRRSSPPADAPAAGVMARES